MNQKQSIFCSHKNVNLMKQIVSQINGKIRINFDVSVNIMYLKMFGMLLHVILKMENI